MFFVAVQKRHNVEINFRNTISKNILETIVIHSLVVFFFIIINNNLYVCITFLIKKKPKIKLINYAIKDIKKISFLYIFQYM